MDGSLSEKASTTARRKVSNVPADALTKRWPNKSSQVSFFDDTAVFEVALDKGGLSATGSSGAGGNVDCFPTNFIPVGLDTSLKSVLPENRSTLAEGSSEVRQLSLTVFSVPSSSFMTVTRSSAKSVTGTGLSRVPSGEKRVTRVLVCSRTRVSP